MAVSLFVAGCGSQASTADAMPPAEVSVAEVVSRDVQPWDEFTGRVSAVESVELRPRVSGYVERVAFDEGQEVAKGDLLFVIDQRRYRAELARAEADLARARSEAQLARTQDARAQSLVEAKAISREEFESRRASRSQAEAAVRAAEAAVANARLDLQFTEVRAPISGRAGRALVTAGNLAQADATVLTTLVSLDPVHVYFEADEQTWQRYNAQAGEKRAVEDNAVRVGLAGESGYPHAGKVDFVDNQVDAGTGTIRARAVVANPDRLLTPGLFARVQLQGRDSHRALLVDDKAVLTDQDRKYVYVLGEGNTAMRKDVRLGREIGDLREVADGLEPGDKVVVHGVQKIFFPGMPVAPTTVEMGAPPAPPQVASAESGAEPAGPAGGSQ
ncbi:efflux RND transporter periplasmic adaptor subunit [Marilutibacter chinensis]|uniref:Efflux RND transporter periplasmic adaptor subunit n=1 Tax=Marilutibacter chinensis TaxID=2912247 RepID=A0ABS9HXS0_9GAMM|nr:efflux RND transporter periplasmic adaptor subunit [Lysobacter chinensis]MCF7223679.1 efflux RND transporter periplasmic adaptor subunit [Lysobacter chinensis]